MAFVSRIDNGNLKSSVWLAEEVEEGRDLFSIYHRHVQRKKKNPGSNLSDLSVIQLDFKIQDLDVGGIKCILNPCFFSPHR